MKPSEYFERLLGKFATVACWYFYLYCLPILIEPHWDFILDKSDIFRLGSKTTVRSPSSSYSISNFTTATPAGSSSELDVGHDIAAGGTDGINMWQVSGLQLTVTFGTFFLANCVYFLLYYLDIPFINRFKVNKNPWPWKSENNVEMRENFWKNLQNAIFLTFFNIFFVAYPISLLSFPSFKQLNIPTSKTEFDSPAKMVAIIFIGMLIDDILFFMGHWALHQPKIYAHIHKMHHSWNYTTSIAVLHLHPLEFALCNVIPNAVGMILTRAHLLTMVIWFHIRILQTLEAHSNYHFPWMMWSGLEIFGDDKGKHEIHHSGQVAGNFGSFFCIGDRLFGTLITSKERVE